MLGKLFLLFTLVTLVEIGLLVFLGNLMGFWWTMVLVFGTGFAGAYLAKSQGLRVLQRIRTSLEKGEVPADAGLDGLLILIAGAFLITPGVLTDGVGFLLLVPFCRAPIKNRIRGRFKTWITNGTVGVRLRSMPRFTAARPMRETHVEVVDRPNEDD